MLGYLDSKVEMIFNEIVTITKILKEIRSESGQTEVLDFRANTLTKLVLRLLNQIPVVPLHSSFEARDKFDVDADQPGIKTQLEHFCKLI